jgi:hypothetical protein
MVDFLVIGSLSMMMYVGSFDLVIQHKKVVGYNKITDFIGDNKKFANIIWITNMREDFPPHLVLSKKYDHKYYKKYDYFDAINIDMVEDIPDDYMGLMGVPITFLDKWNPEQFDVIGVCDGGSGGVDVFAPIVEGECKYARILIKRK